jgi:phosphoribosylglycinamide formyltransferase-1
MLRIAILISGGGTTMEKVLLACQSGEIAGLVTLVIASNGSAGGIFKAQALGVPTIVIKKNADCGGDALLFGDRILEAIQRAGGADLIAQLGWLPTTPPNVIAAFLGRILNQHPGPLDPGYLGFGGQYMHGRAVHTAVLHFARSVKRPFPTEATVHRVTEGVDEGALLVTRLLNILFSDTPDTLAARLLPIEHELVVETIQRFATGRSVEIRRPAPLIRPEERELYFQAMEIGRAVNQH